MKERFQEKKKAVHGDILGLTQGQSQGQMRKAGRGQSSRPSGSSEVSTCLCESEGKKNVAQSCPALCDPMDCSPPGSSVHAILQARTLEWLAMPSPRGSPDPGIEP